MGAAEPQDLDELFEDNLAGDPGAVAAQWVSSHKREENAGLPI
jgi:hypothetical protein